MLGTHSRSTRTPFSLPSSRRRLPSPAPPLSPPCPPTTGDGKIAYRLQGQAVPELGGGPRVPLRRALRVCARTTLTTLPPLGVAPLLQRPRLLLPPLDSLY